MAIPQHPPFPVAPFSLDYESPNKEHLGRKQVDYDRRIRDHTQFLNDLETVKLPKAQNEMNAHKAVLDGAFDFANQLEGMAKELGYSRSELKDWNYIYAAGTLQDSIFFSWTTGGGQFDGRPNLHPPLTYTAGEFGELHALNTALLTPSDWHPGMYVLHIAPTRDAISVEAALDDKLDLS